MPVIDSDTHEEITVTDPKTNKRHLINFPAPVGDDAGEVPRRVAELLRDKIGQHEGEYIIIEDEADDSDSAGSTHADDSADDSGTSSELPTNGEPISGETNASEPAPQGQADDAQTATTGRRGRPARQQG